MKKIFLYLFFIFVFPVFSFCAEPTVETKTNSLTLEQCCNLALKQSELIAIDFERIKQAEAHFFQAFGTLLPQISFSREQTRQHSDNSPSYNKSYEQKFIFKQALFTGFKEFAQISGSKLEKKQRESEIARAKELIFVDVSEAFYLLKELREDLKILEVIKKAFIDRVEDLKIRENLGKSRTSEVVSTQTQIFTLEDEIESVKSQEAVAVELLNFLIGKSVGEIEESEFVYFLKTESEYLLKASSRADVQAAEFAWQIEKKNLTVAKSGFFPALSLESYYFTHRSSSPIDSRWEALLSINIPIFEGTTTLGNVKEASSKVQESELNFKRLNRIASQNIHDAYVNAQSVFLRVSILEKALKSAETNYDLQLKDYKLGIVTNLEVLVAIQSLEDIRRKFNHISCVSKRFYWQLQAASGEIKTE